MEFKINPSIQRRRKRKTEDFLLAKDELIEKCGSMCEIFFGSIPFLFCYAAAGRFIQFFIIDRQRNVTPTTANYFDMSNPESRLRIVSTVLNITWCINEYQNYTITSYFLFNRIITRRNNVTIYFDAKGLTKTINSSKSDYNLAEFDDLEKIYHLIQQKKITNTIECIEVKKSEKIFKVKLTPICSPYGVYKIDSNQRLLNALKCVFRSLNDLHNNGYVHRDVRWDNVLFNDKTSQYLLTDFECAGLINKKLPELLRTHSIIEYPNEFKDQQIPYTVQVDLYLVGTYCKYSK